MHMAYLPLARKYRPQIFDELVGQEHIATTLKNAVKMGMSAHAYLFTGPRGVGKTSTARILAKSLNCEKGPTPTPCGKCASCVEITRGTSMDVIEIDGASNRGIDEIRNLKENIKFASVRGKFRIYIIDEVHMLTQEAFNALLKTLEEPPAHAKFIFATTMPFKVLPTIISRCQRFDFRKIPAQAISKKLKAIKEKEKINLNDEAAFLIAKSADGSLRDAEVILDQLVSFTKGKISADDVTKTLGLLEQGILFDLTDSIAKGDKEELLSIVSELIQSGKDPVFITTGIIGHFRNIMVAKVAKEKSPSYMAISEENFSKLKEQGGKFSLDEVLYITYSLSAAIDLMKKTSLARIPLEITLIKLADAGRLGSIKEILERLSRMDGGLKSTTLERPVIASEAKQSPNEISAAPRNDRVAESFVPKEEVAAERDILLLQQIKNSWSGVINFIKNKKMSIATFLSEGVLLKVRDNVLAVGFHKNKSLHKDALGIDTNKKFVEEAIKSVVGENVFLSIEDFEGPVEEEAPPVNIERDDAEESVQSGANVIDPIVESALGIFDGRIIDIRRAKKEGTR